MLNVCHAMGRAIIIYIVYTHCTKCNAQRKRNARFSLTDDGGSKNGVLVISVCGQWQYEKKKRVCTSRVLWQVKCKMNNRI